LTRTPAAGVNIVGAGLAGSLLAILLARRGIRVTVYERRADPRFNANDSGRSINLALAARGIRALELAGVLDRVMPLAIAMRGRMVHEHDGSAALQMYGVRPEEVIYSVSRSALNRVLIEAAVDFDNLEILFNHVALGLAPGGNAIELRDVSGRVFSAAPQPSIATDGAGSPIRHALAARGVAKVREEFLEHDYKELTIPAVNGQPALDVNALHIWPRGGFMLIALPNRDATFTATLFLARKGPNGFESLKDDGAAVAFLQTELPSPPALNPEKARVL
jgi:kynurenine 3-monooxygenase